jgi:hypothetical protein
VLVIRKGGERRWVQNSGEILEHSVTDLLNYAHEEGLLRSRKLIRYAHHIRWIRNMVVHERMPMFAQGAGEYLEMKVSRSRKARASYATIRLNKKEVADLGSSRGEITAYYCVSRLRQILRGLLAEEEPKSGVENESSGSLFHWEESGQDPEHVAGVGQGNRGAGTSG